MHRESLSIDDLVEHESLPRSKMLVHLSNEGQLGNCVSLDVSLSTPLESQYLYYPYTMSSVKFCKVLKSAYLTVNVIST